VRPSQIRVAGTYRVLLPLPGADDEPVVRLDGHNAPEFLDQVGIKVAVDCGLDDSGVRAGVQGTLLLSVYHHVTRPKSGFHAALSTPLSPPQDSTRISGWGGCAAREVPAGTINLDTREWRKEKTRHLVGE